ncbi:MAG: hypothetical protein R3C16_02140 [Hyphomonadaceae bacterium]
MLTFVESISLAGDRAKQNDDACGFAHGRGWVLDGATDLHDAPLTECLRRRLDRALRQRAAL